MKAGERIGNYIIESPISVGKSGQADIYRGRHVDSGDEPFAIKILAKQLQTDDKSMKNFEEEAELLAKLRHKNIVRLEAFDTSPPNPYIVQEYIEGLSIADLLQRRDSPLPLHEIIDIALQVVDALSYAHNYVDFKIMPTKEGGKSSKKLVGIVHRDLSTDNILINDDGEVKLIDFGIARAAGIRTITTSTGIGKEFYIAPEVEIGSEKTFTPKVDIFSFGVCLYEMIMTLRPEKRRKNVLKQFQRNLHHLDAAFPAGIPDELKNLVIHCVQREPRDRPQTMGEIKERLLGVQGSVGRKGVTKENLPVGIKIGSELLKFDRILRLQREYANDPYLMFSLNEDESRIFLLCDQQRKIYSCNLSGGERKVHHLPKENRLTTIAGWKGEQAVGLLADRKGLLSLDDSGDWHLSEFSEPLSQPEVVPDNAVILGNDLYIGDYENNRICRVDLNTGMVKGATEAGNVERLGPFAMGGSSIFYMDMASNYIHRTNLELKESQRIKSFTGCGWPISIGIRAKMLLFLDSQLRCISAIDENGILLEKYILDWEEGVDISQLVFCRKSSTLVALERSTPALLFFKFRDVSLDILQLSAFIKTRGCEVSELSYQGIESSVLSYIRKDEHGESLSYRLVEELQELSGVGKNSTRLQVAILEELPKIVTDDRKLSTFYRVAEKVDELGDKQKAEELYCEYLMRKDGFDQVVRDKYGKLLEESGCWRDIVDFEVPFLSKSYFKDNPENRWAYSRSYQRLRKAYGKLGIPVPSEFEAPPTGEMETAKQFMSDKNFEEAHRIFSELVESGRYKQMKPEDAFSVLVGNVDSIKNSLRVLSLKDWQEIYRSLHILINEYSGISGYDKQFEIDLRAAEGQIKKLKGSLPKV